MRRCAWWLGPPVDPSAPALPGGAVGAMQASNMSMRTETRVVVIKPRELPHLVDDPRIASTSDDVAALSELQPQRLLTTG